EKLRIRRKCTQHGQGGAMTGSSADHRPHGHRHQDPTVRLVWWTIVLVVATIVLAVASWVAIGLTWYGVKAQSQDARELLQTQIAVELHKKFDSAEMRCARRSLAAQLLAKNGDVSEYRIVDFFAQMTG